MNKPTFKRTYTATALLIFSGYISSAVVYALQRHQMISDYTFLAINRGDYLSILGAIASTIAGLLFACLIISIFIGSWFASAIDNFSLVRWSMWGILAGALNVILSDYGWYKDVILVLEPLICIATYMMIFKVLPAKQKSSLPDESSVA